MRKSISGHVEFLRAANQERLSANRKEEQVSGSTSAASGIWALIVTNNNRVVAR